MLQHIVTTHGAFVGTTCRAANKETRGSLQLQKICVDVTADQNCILSPALTKHLPLCDHKHMRMDLDKVTKDGWVSNLDQQIAFLSQPDYNDCVSLELKGSLQVIANILHQLNIGGGLRKLQRVVIVSEPVSGHLWSYGQYLRKMLCCMSELHDLTLGGVGLRYSQLNMLSSLGKLSILTASDLVCEGRQISLPHLQKSKFAIWGDTDIKLLAHILSGAVKLTDLSIAVHPSLPYQGELPAQRRGRVIDTHSCMDTFTQQLLPALTALRSYYIEANLNEASLAMIAVHPTLIHLTASRMGSGLTTSWTGVTGPKRPEAQQQQLLVPVLPNLKSLGCCITSVHQLKTMIPSISSLKFNSIEKFPEYEGVGADVTFDIFAVLLAEEILIAFQVQLQRDVLRSVTMHSTPILVLEAMDWSLDMVHNPEQYKCLISLCVKVGKFLQEPTADMLLHVPDSLAQLENLTDFCLKDTCCDRGYVRILDGWITALASVSQLACLTLIDWTILQHSADLLGKLRHTTHLRLVGCTITMAVLNRIVMMMNTRKGNKGLLTLEVELCKGVTREECKEVQRCYTRLPDISIICIDKQPFFSEKFDRRRSRDI